MARRRYRRSSSDEGDAGIAIFFLLGVFAIYRWGEALPQPWQVAATVVAFSAVLFLAWSLASLVSGRRRRQRLRAELQALTPTQFEERIQLLLADLGWTNLQRRGGSGDRGVDLVGQLEGEQYVIQCKRYTKKVPPAMVRDLVGALHIQQADRALLVTTSGFTRQGHEEVRNQKVELWDGSVLEEQLARAEELRADPLRVRMKRRRRAVVLYVGLLVNTVLVAYAFAAAGPPPLTTPTASVAIAVAPPTAVPVAPTAGSTVTPTAAPVPSATPAASAAVFNGGNVRAAPDLQGTVLDQVNAGERVELLGRSADGQWLRVTNARGQSGWTHRTLLTLEPALEQALPVVRP